MKNVEKEEAREPFAVATAQAQEEGFSDFSEGSPGEKRRDEIAEGIKAKSADVGFALSELLKTLEDHV